MGNDPRLKAIYLYSLERCRGGDLIQTMKIVRALAEVWRNREAQYQLGGKKKLRGNGKTIVGERVTMGLPY